MLGLAKKRQTVALDKELKPGATERENAEHKLRESLRVLLLEHRSDASGLSAEDRDLLAQLTERLNASDRSALRGAVDTSMAASQIQASVAKSYQDMSDVQNESQIMASAIHELESSISQISETAMSIDGNLNEAADETRTTAQSVQNAAESVRNASGSLDRIVTDMQVLEQASAQIRAMSKTIEDIAGQTNLLALNATIEAARAGEAGKGFAIVAQEVKSLSNQTAKTTEQIAERIQNLENAIEAIVGAVNDAQTSAEKAEQMTTEANLQVQETTTNILQSSEQVSELAKVIGDQRLATSELAKGVERIAHKSNFAKNKLEDAVHEISATEDVVTTQFADLEARKVANYVLYRAKADHMLWKKKLAALLSGMAELNHSELNDHHSCRLGKWYAQEAQGPWSKNPVFRAIEAPHAAVHTNGKKAAEHCERGEKELAQSAYAEMEAASAQVVQMLDEMIRAAETQN